MPSIKCTAKLAKRAGFRLEAAETQSPADWHANVFNFDRRFYLIFVHDLTRLTCLAGPVKKNDLQNLETVLTEALRAVLTHEGFSEATIEFALRRITNMQLRKTDSRSVIGTITDNLVHITHHAAYSGGIEAMGLAKLAQQVNHMPMSPLKWKNAIAEYRQTILHSVS